MRVLLVGNGEFYHVGAFFKGGVESLGHDFVFVDEQDYFPDRQNSLAHKIAYRLLGRRPLSYWSFNRGVLASCKRFQPDIVLIVKGAFVSPAMLKQVKKETNAFLVNYATDDPFNTRVSTADIRASIPHYDLYVCTKRQIMEDVRLAGCVNVEFVPFGYEPTLHFPEKPVTDEEKARFSSDVMFAGGGDEDRFPILRALTNIPDLRLHLYGGYWDKDPKLRPFHRGFALGRDYRLALGGAKIDLCLVRRANRDGHVMRTFEVPACGGFMLAERTAEHKEFFEEGREAVFFGSTEELLDKVVYLLKNDEERQRIAEAGHQKVVAGKHTYRDVMEAILSLAGKSLVERPRQ